MFLTLLPPVGPNTPLVLIYAIVDIRSSADHPLGDTSRRSYAARTPSARTRSSTSQSPYRPRPTGGPVTSGEAHTESVQGVRYRFVSETSLIV